MIRRILVLNDEPALGALITRALSEDGYEVVEDHFIPAKPGLRGKGTFDLIVTNSFIRGLSGNEVVNEISKEYPAVPILHIDDLPQGKHPGDVPEATATSFPAFRVAALLHAVRDRLAS